jgi:hypothetical protein
MVRKSESSSEFVLIIWLSFFKSSDAHSSVTTIDIPHTNSSQHGSFPSSTHTTIPPRHLRHHTPLIILIPIPMFTPLLQHLPAGTSSSHPTTSYPQQNGNPFPTSPALSTSTASPKSAIRVSSTPKVLPESLWKNSYEK